MSDIKGLLEQLYGAEVSAPGIVKKLNTITTDEELLRLFTSYLDESNKPRPTGWNDGSEELSQQQYAEMVVDGKAPLRPEIDFIPFPANVGVYGFCRQPLIEAGIMSGDLSPAEELAHVGPWWCRRRANRKKKAYHLVSSLDPRISLPMKAFGMSAPATSQALTMQTLDEFCACFHAGSTLGYVLAVHNDRHHIHIHCVLFPETNMGKGLNLSPLSLARIDGEPTRVDYQGKLQQAFWMKAADLMKSLEAVKCCRAEEEALWRHHSLTLARRSAAGGADELERELRQIQYDRRPFRRHELGGKLLAPYDFGKSVAKAEANDEPPSDLEIRNLLADVDNVPDTPDSPG